MYNKAICYVVKMLFNGRGKNNCVKVSSPLRNRVEMRINMKNKPKAGILSMHRIYNYGSFLQAYGLKEILKELGCEVEFADYHPGECLIKADGGTGIKRKLSKVSETLRYNASLKDKIKFIKYKKNYAANNYPYLGIDDKMNYNPKVDVLVIGSDEVFNCVQNNTNVGFAPEFFGVGNRAGKLITYAASCGNTTYDKLVKYKVKDKVAEWLKAFDDISVRDNNTGEVVKKLIGKEPVYNLDPVLAYDYIGKCDKIKKEITDKNYMILYGYSGRFSKEECKKIRAYADRRGLKIYCIGGIQNCCDKFIDCSPFDVIAYFKNSSCVVTDTFHGTILSVITHRRFVSLVRNSGYGNSQKLTDLLIRLKLEDRIAESLEDIDNILAKAVDYTDTDMIIKEERKNTYDYLKNAIGRNGDLCE